MASFIWPPMGSGSGGGVTSLNGETGAVVLVAGTGITITPAGQNITIAATGAELVFADSIVNNSGTVTLVNDSAAPGATKYYGTNSGGTLGYYSIPATGVTSVSVVSANGFAGTVATPTTTPAITLSTTITGVLQGNGTAISAYSPGNLTDVGTDGITITAGTGAVFGSGTSISQHVADTTHNGYLSSTDWNTFNGKQASGNYITALTGDVTATGPGSVAATLATVNSNVGSFGSSTAIPSFTVNGKGLITAASTNVVIAPAGTLSGTTLNSTVVSSSLTSVGTLTAGTWNASTITVPFGGTGDTSFTAYSVICAGTTSTGALQNVSGVGTAGQFLTSNGAAALPTWQTLTSTAIGYAQAYFGLNYSASVTSTGSYADFTYTGSSDTLTTRTSSGITLTAAASNLPGVTFTPSSSSAVYHITVTAVVYTSAAGAAISLQLTDGTTVIQNSNQFQQQAVTAGVVTSITISGIYAPGTTSPVTVKLQGIVSSATGFIYGGANLSANPLEFTVEQIPNNIYGSTLSLGAFGSTPNANGLSLSAGILNMQPADGTHPGGVSTTTQTFAGAKSISTGGSTTAFNIDSPAFVFDSTNFALGINTAPNTATFIDGVNSSGATKRIVLTGYGTSSLVGMRTRLARGTSGSPAAVQSGDILGFYNAEGYGTSQFPATATGALTFTAQETFTNTSNATQATINVTPTGAVASSVGLKVATTGQLSLPLFYTTAGTLYNDASGNITSNTSSGSFFLTAGSTYTTPSNITTATRFNFVIVGGGGGGGGVGAATNNIGSGGGGGGTVVIDGLTGLTANTAYTISIGGGGSGVSGAGGNAGGNTTLTIGATTYTAGGGGGGLSGSSVLSGAGGTATNGTLNIPGGPGMSNGASSTAGPGPNGGPSGLMYGAGGQAPVRAVNSAGVSATGYGGGGSGAVSANAAPAANAGGSGTGGCIRGSWIN